MFKNKGFISIFSLLIMTIILIASLYLMKISKIGYLITNSNKNKIQSYYTAESKVYMILNKEQYYNQLLLEIEEYLKMGMFWSFKIHLDKEVLGIDNKFEDVDGRFAMENNRLLVELKTKGSYNNINSVLLSKITVLNKFYELGFPILSENTISVEDINYYVEYMNMMQYNISIPTKNKDVVSIDTTGYDSINIINGTNNKKHIEFFRKSISKPIKTETVTNEEIFLLGKNNKIEPIDVNISSADPRDKTILKGVFYIEGSFNICNNTEIQGILIVNNGNILIKPSSKLNVNGLILLKDYKGNAIENQNNIDVNYNKEIILKNGAYLPGFIDPEIKLIKNY